MPESSTLYTSQTTRSREYRREYIPAGAFDGRSPCPALNTLANHGYIQRNGHHISFFELRDALLRVYNISWFLATLLTLVGFLISGKWSFVRRGWSIPSFQWTISLSALSARGPHKIAHDAAFVHPDYVPSCSPNRTLLEKLLTFASSSHGRHRLSGLSLVDLAAYHKIREDQLHSPLNTFHEQIALGECAMTWAVMRRRSSTGPKEYPIDEREEIVTKEVLKDWLGKEQLPEDWFGDGGSRPVHPVGIFEVRRRAGHITNYIGK